MRPQRPFTVYRINQTSWALNPHPNPPPKLGREHLPLPVGEGWGEGEKNFQGTAIDVNHTNQLQMG